VRLTLFPAAAAPVPIAGENLVPRSAHNSDYHTFLVAPRKADGLILSLVGYLATRNNSLVRKQLQLFTSATLTILAASCSSSPRTATAVGQPLLPVIESVSSTSRDSEAAAHPVAIITEVESGTILFVDLSTGAMSSSQGYDEPNAVYVGSQSVPPLISTYSGLVFVYSAADAQNLISGQFTSLVTDPYQNHAYALGPGDEGVG
jgi:hypothetical protein